MNSFSTIRLLLCAFFTAGALARAGTLFEINSTLSAADPTQSGRISRNLVSSVWTSTKPFPGTLNGGTSYHFHTFTIPAATIALAPFLQISLDDTNNTFFVAAYDTVYSPDTSFTSGYLGDIGNSGQEFNGPQFFQVTLPAGHDLVLVVNDVDDFDGGVGSPFHLVLDGFVDVQFTEGNSVFLAKPTLAGTNMVFNCTNAFAAEPAYVLATTNLAAPLFFWTPILTNSLNATSTFTFTATNAVNRSVPARFFTVQPQ